MKKSSFRKKLITLSATISVSVCSISMPVFAGWQQIGCMGDLNNDAQVNIADLLLLSKYILNQISLTSENSYHVNYNYYSINGKEADNSLEYLQTADINQDGKIDIFDLIMMRKYVINKWADPVYSWSDKTETSSSTSTETTTSTTSTSSATTTSTTSTTAPLKPEVTLWGDTNVDGKVNISDAVLIMQSIANPDEFSVEEQGKLNGDVVDNGNGLTNVDALAIQYVEIKTITNESFPMTSAELDALAK